TNWAVTCSARSILARNISKYFSEPGRPSQIFSIKELVPEIIWIRLFSSLATLELWFFSCELNNLIQIISGTSSLIENIWEGRPGSEKYFEMLRASIERAEQVTAQLVAQAGGTNRKKLLPPDLEQRFDE